MRLTLKSSCLYFMFKVDRSIGCKLHWQRRRQLRRRHGRRQRRWHCGVHGALADSGHKTKQLSDCESKESDVLRVCIICILMWCSTFSLALCCCKLSHVIFLKLTKFTGWQPSLMKRKLGLFWVMSFCEFVQLFKQFFLSQLEKNNVIQLATDKN